MYNIFESLKGGTSITHGLEVKLVGLKKLTKPIVAMSITEQTKKNFARVKEILI